MIHRILFKIIIFIFLSGCGYTPLYSSFNNEKENIQILNSVGDNKINSKIISKLRIHNNADKDLIKISLNTVYRKKDLQKNSSGEVEEYELEAITTYDVVTIDSEKKIIIEESFIMKNFNDDFEEKNYEDRIKISIANLNYQKLMLQLNKMK